MFPVMRTASKVNGYIFIVMLAGMLVYSLPAVFGFARTQTQSVSLFVDGQLLRQFEQFYDKRFFLRDLSVRHWANLQYLLFREGSSGVVLGRDGWLFTNQEYHSPNDLQSNIDNQLADIDRVRLQLQAAGKQLILLPVPMKLDVYRQHALQQPDARLVNLHDEFVADLQARGVAVSPVRAAFLEQGTDGALFVRNDTHWSPAGARLAANELARQYPDLLGQSDYVSEAVGEKALKGDLVNFLNFDPRLAPVFFRTEPVVLYETLQRQQSFDAADLFGEVKHSLLVVGTSYTAMDDWNFVGFLKQALQSDLLDVALEARGPFHAMDVFLDSEAFASPELKTVIWEFPVRTLLAHRTNLRDSSLDPQPTLATER
ncbi:alginate O-acetyltransferase [Halopseudomonas salegens]|uniref:Probable alginate O-acetylase AlgJ n=1 Tax=Halopseudomonas salegens TaxID=1434072 RepID=A0A1H2HSU2_9GAMM|nr:alginate O-acetyltransferase [Halopseudomonas salegens]SDU34970.1 alginate O-acetyltransferase complex protein AlgJ [Halopseudomonas salegens]